MSREQASAFKKHRFAGDKDGDLAWSHRVTQRALRASSSAAARDIEGEFELIDVDRVLWRLLALPRRYSDLERAGPFPPDDLRAVLRAFVAADVVDIVDENDARALLPAEVKRARAEVAGKEWRTNSGSITGKVYRPDIGISSEGQATGSQEGAAVDDPRTPTSPAMRGTGSVPSSPPTSPRVPTSPSIPAFSAPRTATNPGVVSPGFSAPRTATNPGVMSPGFSAPRTATNPGVMSPGFGAPRTATNPGITSPGFSAPRSASGAASGVGPRAGTNPAMPAFQAPRTGSAVTSTSMGVPRTASSPSTPAPPFAYSRALLPAEKTIKDQIEQTYAKLGRIDHYAFLGIATNADDAAIRAAYVGLAREYHPDRIAGTPLVEDPSLREQIESLFKRLGEAQKTLTNAETRARYDRDLKTMASSGGASTTGPNARPRRPTEARNAFIMAETYFKKRDYAQAELHYRQAANFDPEEPMIAVALAWCIFMNPDQVVETRREDAKRRLEEALKKFQSGEAAYRLGRVWRELGDEARALKMFEQAVKLTPNHVDANRELRIVEMRRQKGEQPAEDEKKGGLLDKLFKR
jgi:tetratricopeptide (TPR) repeat protein